MKITGSDVSFYQARMLPDYIKRHLKHPPNAVSSLHSAINMRAGDQVRDTEKSNACHVLKLVRNRGEYLYGYMVGAMWEYREGSRDAADPAGSSHRARSASEAEPALRCEASARGVRRQSKNL